MRQGLDRRRQGRRQGRLPRLPPRPGGRPAVVVGAGCAPSPASHCHWGALEAGGGRAPPENSGNPEKIRGPRKSGEKRGNSRNLEKTLEFWKSGKKCGGKAESSFQILLDYANYAGWCEKMWCKIVQTGRRTLEKKLLAVMHVGNLQFWSGFWTKIMFQNGQTGPRRAYKTRQNGPKRTIQLSNE